MPFICMLQYVVNFGEELSISWLSTSLWVVVTELSKYIWDQEHLNLMHFVWKLRVNLVTHFHLF